MKIELHDLIGIHSGMNFYLNSFYVFLEDNIIKTTIHSNYSPDKNKQFYPNIYKGSKFKRIYFLSLCYTRYFYSVLRLRREKYIIVLTYGTIIDIPLLLMSAFNKRVIIDMHEVLALDSNNKVIRILFQLIYKILPNKIISHSKKTTATLKSFGYSKELLFVPHIHYKIELQYNLGNIAKDVQDCYKENRKYFLFFGHIRPSKGIFELLSAIETINDTCDILKIIIAGQDTENNLGSYKNSIPRLNNTKIINRYINEDEMKYLFENSDFILLPYREISQSGILEMAVTFKKPILASNIPYFQNIINEYPSFGQLVNPKNSQEFAKSLISVANNLTKKEFYIEKDLENYSNQNIFDEFISKLKEMNNCSS